MHIPPPVTFSSEIQDAAELAVVLRSRSLEELKLALKCNLEIPPEEPILGAAAHQYFQLAGADPRRYDGFVNSIRQAGIELSKSRRIIDIGCGVAVLTVEMARAAPGAAVLGFDVSPDMTHYAKAYVAQVERSTRDRLSIQEASVYGLIDLVANTPLSSADLVISRNVFHRLSDPSAAITQALRTTGPGGALFLTAFVGDLDDRETIAQLLADIKHRSCDALGQPMLAFARCYLDAVLRAHHRTFWEKLAASLQETGSVRSVTLNFRSYETELLVRMS